MFKANIRNTTKISEICSKLTVKAQDLAVLFLYVDFKHISLNK